jgi:malonyl-CoA O-methyltransferase
MAALWKIRKTGSVLSPRDGYDRWAGSYAGESNPVKSLSNEVLEGWLPDVAGIEVLDAGCGTGHFCELLAKRNLARITGIDLSPAMIDVASKRVPAASFICDDLNSLQLANEKYDLVVCALVLGHIRDLDPVLSKLIASVRKGGTIIISDFHPFLTLQKSRRTFKDSTGKTFEIAHHLHLLSELIHIIHREGMVLEKFAEPMWQEMPAIYAIKANKI